MEEKLIYDLEAEMAKRGEKVYGFLPITQKADCSWVKIPVIIVNGEKDGPVCVVDSCTHGDEYEGAEAISKFAEEVKTFELRGTWIGIPGLNLEAFSYGKRENHMDYSYGNMNRIFPGNEDAYITQRIAKFYLDHVLSKADFLISFHGGGNVLYVTPQVGYQDPSNATGEISHRMAKAIGFKCLYGGKNSAFAGTMRSESYKLGLPSITVEIGSQSCRHSERFININRAAEGICSVLREMDMMEGSPRCLDEYIDSEYSLTYIYAKFGGFHIPVKQPEEKVKKGEVLAIVKDLFGNQVEQVKAPFDGVVYGYCDYPIVQPGNWSYLFARYDF